MPFDNLFGITFALMASLCFAGNRSFASKPLLVSRPIVGAYIGIAIGVVITGAAVIALGQEIGLLFVTVSIAAIFAIVGIFHFAVARQLSFIAIKNIGANESSAIVSTQILYSLIFAVLVLGENLNFGTGLGSAIIFAGLLVLDVKSGATMRKGSFKTGVTAALLTGLIYGLTPILIKAGLSLYTFFLTATFIAYVAAMIAFAVSVNPKTISSEIVALPKFAIASYVIAGACAASAQLFRFGALSFAPVVTVAPILSIAPIFTLLFTRRLAKESEVFHPRIILSIVLMVFGTILISYASGISV